MNDQRIKGKGTTYYYAYEVERKETFYTLVLNST